MEDLCAGILILPFQFHSTLFLPVFYSMKLPLWVESTHLPLSLSFDGVSQ